MEAITKEELENYLTLHHPEKLWRLSRKGTNEVYAMNIYVRDDVDYHLGACYGYIFQDKVGMICGPSGSYRFESDTELILGQGESFDLFTLYNIMKLRHHSESEALKVITSTIQDRRKLSPFQQLQFVLGNLQALEGPNRETLNRKLIELEHSVGPITTWNGSVIEIFYERLQTYIKTWSWEPVDFTFSHPEYVMNGI